MKNKIAFVISIVIIAVLAFLSVRAYQRYQTNQRNLAQASYIAQQNEIANQEAARSNAEKASKTKLYNQCLALQATYNGLTTAQKAKVTPPNCEIIKVQ